MPNLYSAKKYTCINKVNLFFIIVLITILIFALPGQNTQQDQGKFYLLDTEG